MYTNLIDTIHESLPLLHRYMKLRKKLLGVDELHMYDLFAPLVDEYKMDITYEDAKKQTKEGVSHWARTIWLRCKKAMMSAGSTYTRMKTNVRVHTVGELMVPTPMCC